MKIYLAGPIFSEADRQWIRCLKGKLEAISADGFPVVVLWPFQIIRSLPPVGPEQMRDRILRVCQENLDAADIVVAVLDGSQVDDGTAWEIGYFFARNPGRQIVGMRTDSRRAGETEAALVNSLIHSSCSTILESSDELTTEVEKISRSLRPLQQYPGP